MDSQRKNSGVRSWSFHALCHLLGDVWLQHELSSLSYRAISLITYGPRDRCYWIQCEPDNIRAELLITFVLNVKGTDAVCISRCEHVLWVWTVASRFRVSLPNWWSSGSNADLSKIGRARCILDCPREKNHAHTCSYNESRIPVSLLTWREIIHTRVPAIVPLLEHVFM